MKLSIDHGFETVIHLVLHVIPSDAMEGLRVKVVEIVLGRLRRSARQCYDDQLSWCTSASERS